MSIPMWPWMPWPPPPPLADSVDKGAVSLLDMFLGLHGGMMGEVCTLAILLGLAYLLVTRTIGFAIPGSILITMFVLTFAATRDLHNTLVELMGGGLLFGAVFMATDYVTSPFTTRGRIIYGVVIGLLTFIMRNFSSMNEGMSFAILLGNLLTPWFNAWSHQIPLGRTKPKKAANNKAAAASAEREGQHNGKQTDRCTAGRSKDHGTSRGGSGGHLHRLQCGPGRAEQRYRPPSSRKMPASRRWNPTSASCPRAPMPPASPN